MKRIILGLFISGTALALVGSAIQIDDYQIATAATPTIATFYDYADGGHGLLLNDVKGFRVGVCTVEGQNLGATGTLKAYVYDDRINAVVRNSGLDKTVIGGAPCEQFPDQETVVPYQKLIYASSGLTTADAGTLLSDAGTAAFRVFYRGWKTP